MADSSALDTVLVDDAEYTGLDLSDLVLDGAAAGGRVWCGRRFVDCTLYDADLRGLVRRGHPSPERSARSGQRGPIRSAPSIRIVSPFR